MKKISCQQQQKQQSVIQNKRGRCSNHQLAIHCNHINDPSHIILLMVSYTFANVYLYIILYYDTNNILHIIQIAIDFWKHFSERPLDTIFHPKSVALIGASEKPGSVGRTILWNLLSSPFGGTIYPVNNRLKKNGTSNNIFGIKSYVNVKDIPEEGGIDLVIIAVPSRAVKEVCVFICVVYTCVCLSILTHHNHTYLGYERLCLRIGQRSNHNLGWI